MKQLKTILTSLALIFGLSLSFAGTSYAAGTIDLFPSTACNGNTTICPDKNGDGVFALVKTIINVLLTVAGITAVIMIIIGGIRYVTSNGEQAHIKSAKDTILYAIVGLVVTILAFAIVNFVVGKF